MRISGPCRGSGLLGVWLKLHVSSTSGVGIRESVFIGDDGCNLVLGLGDYMVLGLRATCYVALGFDC
jgi:hypothetical protein